MPMPSCNNVPVWDEHRKGDSPMRYKIALHRSDEGYSVWIPGLPGCCLQGETEAEAIANLKIAARECLSAVEELIEGGEVREIEVTV